MGFTSRDHSTLVEAIRKVGAVAILDYKLNDIGDTMESALFHFSRWGYDAVTFNPFLGNLAQTVKYAHGLQPQVGIICLVLTSNPEAVRYQKEASIRGERMFLATAMEAKDADADGAVVGATGHITIEDIKAIRRTLGPDIVMLVPGVGTQRGDPDKVIKGVGSQLVLNVGRDIIYSDNPTEQAKSYFNMFRELSHKD